MHAPSTDRHVLLIHGGLAESMDAERFWVMPGILDALTGLGFVVDAPDRDTTPSSWIAAADELARSLRWSSTVVGASNGVSVAVRLALQHPSLVRPSPCFPPSRRTPGIDAPPNARSRRRSPSD